MLILAGIENNNDGRSIAWALEHPGCFAYGEEGQAALANLQPALHNYAAWIMRHEPAPWLDLSGQEVEFFIDGTWEVYNIDDDMRRTDKQDTYSVESFYPLEWKPVTSLEITHALLMLEWSRQDLLDDIRDLSPEKLEKNYPGERWSINGILKHVGGAEWWYLDRLGMAFPREDVPADPLERLEKVRQHLNATLPSLAGVEQVIGKSGELWSPRKLLRRALWHERDHVEHIRKLLPR